MFSTHIIVRLQQIGIVPNIQSSTQYFILTDSPPNPSASFFMRTDRVAGRSSLFWSTLRWTRTLQKFTLHVAVNKF